MRTASLLWKERVGQQGGEDRFSAEMLAACRGAAEAAGIDYPRLVYSYLEKQISLAILIALGELCRLGDLV
jgi:hypothetical protein